MADVPTASPYLPVGLNFTNPALTRKHELLDEIGKKMALLNEFNESTEQTDNVSKDVQEAVNITANNFLQRCHFLRQVLQKISLTSLNPSRSTLYPGEDTSMEMVWSTRNEPNTVWAINSALDPSGVNFYVVFDAPSFLFNIDWTLPNPTKQLFHHYSKSVETLNDDASGRRQNLTPKQYNNLCHLGPICLKSFLSRRKLWKPIYDNMTDAGFNRIVCKIDCSPGYTAVRLFFRVVPNFLKLLEKTLTRGSLDKSSYVGLEILYNLDNYSPSLVTGFLYKPPNSTEGSPVSAKEFFLDFNPAFGFDKYFKQFDNSGNDVLLQTFIDHSLPETLNYLGLQIAHSEQ